MSKLIPGTDIVFLFGSGASTPPLLSQQGLVRGLLNAPTQPRIRPAKKYLQHAFLGLNKPNVNKDGIRFEDIVGPLEIAESEEYWFHFGGQDTDKALITNKTVLDSLDSWLAMSLDPQTLPKPPGKKSTSTDRDEFSSFYAPSKSTALTYARLLYFLSETGLLKKSAFLSMNYDILFDRALYASSNIPDYWIDHFYVDPAELGTPTAAENASIKATWLPELARL